jgi:death-on-curing protein
VLTCRLAWNHPLPDGNKRAAWVALRAFVELNGWHWDPTPTVDEAEQAMMAIAAGDWDEPAAAEWLHGHLRRGQHD